MKKRGISPLIATVLLIGFVVAVAAIVMMWGKGFIQERAEKEGSLSQAQLECNLIEIEIEEIDGVISVTNIGSAVIGGFIIRGNGVIQDYEPLSIMGTRKLFGEEEVRLGSGDEIIPAIRPEGAGAPLVPCSGKSKKIRG